MDSSDRLAELYTQHRAQQDRYDFFLMAVAGSAIALSIQRTTEELLGYSMIPLGIAVLLWGVSFFAGCKRRAYVNVITFANFNLVLVQRGEHSDAGSDPQDMEAAAKGIRTAIAANNDKAQSCARFQFATLVAGAVAYIVWHVLEMALATWAVRPG